MCVYATNTFFNDLRPECFLLNDDAAKRPPPALHFTLFSHGGVSLCLQVANGLVRDRHCYCC
jgi:hypothetical protein